MQSVLDVFCSHFDKYSVNNVLADKIKRFRINWGTKDEYYIEFLTSGLIGVHPIRFSEQDTTIFFQDVLDIDKDIIQKEFYKCNGINKSFKVSSDATNLCILCLMHLFSRSSLSKDKIKEALTDLYHIFSYKQIGSMYSHYFKRDFPISQAKTVFESLSDKYLIRKLGTWELLLDHQANVVLPPHGSNAKRILSGTTDDMVRTINDFQNRIRDVIKNLCQKLYEIKDDEKSKIVSTSIIENIKDGEGSSDAIKEITNNYVYYTNYLKSIFNNPYDFINKDFIYVVSKYNKNVTTDKLEQVLYYLSETELPNSNNVDFISGIIESSIHLLKTKGILTDYKRRLPEVLKYLSSFYKSSRGASKEVRESKAYLEKRVGEALNTVVKWVIVPVTLSVCLYLFLRAILHD